jgi:hypothetical protein
MTAPGVGQQKQVTRIRNTALPFSFYTRTTMDRFEQLISTSQCAAGILGNVETGVYELLPLADGDVLSPAQHDERKRLGLVFIGVTTLQVDGTCRTMLAVPLDDVIAEALADGFVAYVTEKIKARNLQGGTAWLEKLASLPDPRDN